MRPVSLQTTVRIAAIAAVISLTGCASRYRLELDVVEAGVNRRVQVEETQYARRAVLGDPLSESVIRSGDGSCIVVLTGARVRQKEDGGKYEVLSYDEHLQYRLYLQLPAKLSPGTVQLAENSFVQIVGRYEVSMAEKIYPQAAGTLVIDSLAHNRAFLSIDGQYQNQSGKTVAVKGEFKVKIK